MAAPAPTRPYERHRPEETLLYQLIETHYPAFRAQLEAQGQTLPAFVKQEFDEFLKCGRLDYGFLRVCCEDCKHERLVAFSCKRRGFCPSCGARRMAESAALLVDEVLPKEPIRQWVLSFPYELRFLLAQQPAGFNKRTAHTGAVTLIQRFGSALNLNIHFHMLFLDGVYAEDKYGVMRFHRVKAPAIEELSSLVHQLSHRVTRVLEKKGWLQRDDENTYLLLDAIDQEDDALGQLQGHSITYRIAMGPQKGRKVFTLQSLPPRLDTPRVSDRVAKQAGFSLHAGVMAEAHQRDVLERLCRYISRPAVSEKRLALTSNGKVRYELKTPYRDGTTHVFFDPLDFMARLAALVPKPRVNLTRFHGIFAPNSKHRALITPAKRGKGRKLAKQGCSEKTIAERRKAMTWMQRLKRVFNIDIEKCELCGGHVKVVSCIEDPAVIEKILQHLAMKESLPLPRVHEARAPPDQAALFQL
jgi:hypothetical protein